MTMTKTFGAGASSSSSSSGSGGEVTLSGTTLQQQTTTAGNTKTVFGRVQATTDWRVLATNGLWPTPQPGSATTLRVKAGNANDTAAGSGARTVLITGLDATGAEVSDTLTTAGASASAASSNSYIRLHSFNVATSGTYGNPAGRVGSNSANMYIENSAGTEDWSQLFYDEMGYGSSPIGCYTVPLGKTAYINDVFVTVGGGATTDTADIALYTRSNVLETAAPYSPLVLLQEFFEVGYGGFALPLNYPFGAIAALTDIVVMARASTGVVPVASKLTLTLV